MAITNTTEGYITARASPNAHYPLTADRKPHSNQNPLPMSAIDLTVLTSQVSILHRTDVFDLLTVNENDKIM